MDKNNLIEFAKRYTAAWCSQNAESVAAFYAEDSSLKINDGTPSVGRAEISAAAQSFMTAFPDMKLTMDNLLIKADETQYHWSFVGTNTGADGTGNKVIFTGFERWSFNEEGLIRSSIGKFDENDYNRQLRN